MHLGKPGFHRKKEGVHREQSGYQSRWRVFHITPAGSGSYQKKLLLPGVPRNWFQRSIWRFLPVFSVPRFFPPAGPLWGAATYVPGHFSILKVPCLRFFAQWHLHFSIYFLILQGNFIWKIKKIQGNIHWNIKKRKGNMKKVDMQKWHLNCKKLKKGLKFFLKNV